MTDLDTATDLPSYTLTATERDIALRLALESRAHWQRVREEARHEPSSSDWIAYLDQELESVTTLIIALED